MKTLPSVLQSAFWGAYRSDTSISLIHQEKVWTRLRWIGVLAWWLLISAPDAPALQPVASIIFGLGLVYCGFCHYVVYRLHRGRPLVVPVPLLDTALVSLMCGVSGGIDSPALAYFYVISLAVGIRFGSVAGLVMAALQALFCLELFALLSGTGTGIAPHPQIASLFLAGGIGAVLFPTQPSAAAQPTHRQASLQATEQLWSVNRALGSLDVDTVMQQLVDTLERLLACEGVGLILLDRPQRTGRAYRSRRQLSGARLHGAGRQPGRRWLAAPGVRPGHAGVGHAGCPANLAATRRPARYRRTQPVYHPGHAARLSAACGLPVGG